MKRDTDAAVETIKKNMHVDPKIGVILGSGLGKLVEEFENPASIRYGDIPNFPIPAVEGHKGEVVAGSLAGVSVLAFSGRIHYYEGYTMEEVCFPVRVMSGLGVETVIITNAAGAVNETYSPGDIVIIADHINLMGDNPLRGTTHFIDMTEAYSHELRAVAHDVAGELGLKLDEGVYLVLSGPSFESPAEIRMMRIMGADLVGMSTIPEVIMANKLGMKVLGLSMVTNMAAGITGRPLTHTEVIEATRKAADKFKGLVRGIVERLGKA
ncbi:MAG: purine-nucleoside phosphorylase [Deltaproteobacteria bacterium]|nr:MAG: purine-nucleoside phosphorylase [Deltaproteobacteria bacterium]